jgi:hypothetical protein
MALDILCVCMCVCVRVGVGVCVLCQLAAPGLEFHSNPGAAKRHNMHAI